MGSTNKLVNTSNGNPISSYYYNSYGKLEDNQSNPTATNTFTYTGREDDGNELYYYRNRYYDPNLEMFISQDPIFMGEAQRYVGGNPLSFTDPLGLDKTISLYDPGIGGGYGSGSQIIGGAGVVGFFAIQKFLEDRTKNNFSQSTQQFVPSCNNNDKICDIQATSDTTICNRLPTKATRSRYFASSNERLGYCRAKGILGYPPLIRR